MYYIGIDLGTSAVKLLLMDEEGKIVNIVSREYPLYFPHPGWSEQKPEDWWEQSKEGIRELVKDVDKSQVAGISFGGQMHGLVILDENDNVIRPAILWNDGRTAKQTDYLNTVIGKRKTLRVHRKHCICRLYRTEDSLGRKKMSRNNFDKNLTKSMLTKRLPGIPSLRRIRKRLLRCIGHASDGCQEQMLVQRDGRNLRYFPGDAAGAP